jgi:hypothetical protein
LKHSKKYYFFYATKVDSDKPIFNVKGILEINDKNIKLESGDTIIKIITTDFNKKHDKYEEEYKFYPIT